MFEEEFRNVPIEPPRQLDSLPGLRVWGILPKWALAFPLFFALFFLTIPLSLMNADPAMRMATHATEMAQAHVVSVNDGSACRGSASHRIIYEFSSGAGLEYRRAEILCEDSPYYSVKMGDAIQVRYLVSDPTVSTIPDGARSQEPPVVIFLIMPFFFLA